MKLISIIAFLLCAKISLSQNSDNTCRKNEGNIYYHVLKEYLHFMTNENRKFDTLYLEDDYKITDSLPTVCGKTIIVKFNAQDLNRIIAKKRDIILYRLYPLKYDNREFSIDLVPRNMGYNKKRKRYESLYGGGYILYYKFDGVKFYFSRIEPGGI
jgi:hypothetical protein